MVVLLNISGAASVMNAHVTLRPSPWRSPRRTISHPPAASETNPSPHWVSGSPPVNSAGRADTSAPCQRDSPSFIHGEETPGSLARRLGRRIDNDAMYRTSRHPADGEKLHSGAGGIKITRRCPFGPGNRQRNHGNLSKSYTRKSLIIYLGLSLGDKSEAVERGAEVEIKNGSVTSSVPRRSSL